MYVCTFKLFFLLIVPMGLLIKFIWKANLKIANLSGSINCYWSENKIFKK